MIIELTYGDVIVVELAFLCIMAVAGWCLKVFQLIKENKLFGKPNR